MAIKWSVRREHLRATLPGGSQMTATGEKRIMIKQPLDENFV